MTTPHYRTSSPKVTDRDEMPDFERRMVTLLDGAERATKRVYVSGSGPAVIVMAEMPGIYAHVIKFARTVRDAGFTVWMPALFGTEGGPVSMVGGLGTMRLRACRREVLALAATTAR